MKKIKKQKNNKDNKELLFMNYMEDGSIMF